MSTKGRHLNVIKPIYDKHTVNTVLKGNKRKAFLELWDKVRTPTLTICVQHTTGSPSHSNQARKKKKRILLGAGRRQNCPCMQMTWYSIYKALKMHTQTAEPREGASGLQSGQACCLGLQSLRVCVCVCVCVCARAHAHMLSRVQLFVTPQTVARQAPLPRDSPGKNTEVGCHVLLQGIFPTQGSNASLCTSCAGRQIPYP